MLHTTAIGQNDRGRMTSSSSVGRGYPRGALRSFCPHYSATPQRRRVVHPKGIRRGKSSDRAIDRAAWSGTRYDSIASSRCFTTRRETCPTELQHACDFRIGDFPANSGLHRQTRSSSCRSDVEVFRRTNGWRGWFFPNESAGLRYPRVEVLRHGKTIDVIVTEEYDHVRQVTRPEFLGKNACGQREAMIVLSSRKKICRSCANAGRGARKGCLLSASCPLYTSTVSPEAKNAKRD